MISSVSSVSFRGTPAPAANVDPISRIGAYTKPEALPNAPKAKKKGGFWRGLGKLVLTAAVVAGAILATHKLGWAAKLAGKENKFVKTVGSWIETAGKWLDKNAWQKVAGIFKKAPAETPAA